MRIREKRRADEMWSCIQPRLASLAGRPAGKRSLSGLDIIDLGSGYGDLALRALQDGADYVACVDSNNDNLGYVERRLIRGGIGQDRFSVWLADLSLKSHHRAVFQRSFDVGLCTSVLPYLEHPDELLSIMSQYCAISVIECQYEGDGPGFSYIKDDIDMQRWLSRRWRSVQKIGETKLDIRPTSRSIWACAIPSGM